MLLPIVDSLLGLTVHVVTPLVAVLLSLLGGL
jgi:hypothetical protein